MPVNEELVKAQQIVSNMFINATGTSIAIQATEPCKELFILPNNEVFHNEINRLINGYGPSQVGNDSYSIPLYLRPSKISLASIKQLMETHMKEDKVLIVTKEIYKYFPDSKLVVAVAERIPQCKFKSYKLTIPMFLSKE